MQEPYCIRRVSWICIQNNKMLMLRVPGGSLYFDPGGKCPILRKEANFAKLRKRLGKEDVMQGDFDRLMLKRKLARDLDIGLDEESLERFTSFRAPAVGKEKIFGDEVWVEQHCYWSHHSGEIRSTARKEVAWFLPYDNRPRSPAADAILMRIREEGLFLI